ncbi:hypothetical protein P3T76_007065 [Phytophthora citrophthora]|uniref:Uncharacterized protein n=1 Tax=Phytophthora citrophthora TaxID=4793 RepID=A0AAD9LNI3_9STRA|nr:hypothetical protein P3T76_007065 [Phytophthora citrophthora]
MILTWFELKQKFVDVSCPRFESIAFQWTGAITLCTLLVIIRKISHIIDDLYESSFIVGSQ